MQPGGRGRGGGGGDTKQDVPGSPAAGAADEAAAQPPGLLSSSSSQRARPPRPRTLGSRTKEKATQQPAPCGSARSQRPVVGAEPSHSSSELRSRGTGPQPQPPLSQSGFSLGCRPPRNVRAAPQRFPEAGGSRRAGCTLSGSSVPPDDCWSADQRPTGPRTAGWLLKAEAFFQCPRSARQRNFPSYRHEFPKVIFSSTTH